VDNFFHSHQQSDLPEHILCCFWQKYCVYNQYFSNLLPHTESPAHGSRREHDAGTVLQMQDT